MGLKRSAHYSRPKLSLWTFQPVDVLVHLCSALGVDKGIVAGVWSSSAGTLEIDDRDQLRAAGFRFASVRARATSFCGVRCTADALIEVSPFDVRFPEVDWLVALPRQDEAVRSMQGAFISSLVTYDKRVSPSSLTLYLGRAARPALRRLPRALDALGERILGVGYFRGLDVRTMEPDLLEPQWHRREKLTERFARVHPIMLAPVDVARRVGTISDEWEVVRSSTHTLHMRRDDVDDQDLPREPSWSEVLLDSPSSAQVDDELERSGVVANTKSETGSWWIVFGTRKGHPLEPQRAAFFETFPRRLVPLIPGQVARMHRLVPTQLPVAEVDEHRAGLLQASVADSMRELSTARDLPACAEILISAMRRSAMEVPPGHADRFARLLAATARS